MANKKITLQNDTGEKLYPATIAEQIQYDADNTLLQVLQDMKDATEEKLGKTEKASSSASADVADSSSFLYTQEKWTGDVNEMPNIGANLGYYPVLPSTNTNIPTAMGWQNSILTMGLHATTGATAQMFFSYKQPLYYRSDPAAEWQQIRYISDLVTTSHIADTAITPAKIQTDIALNGTPSMTVEPTTSSPDKTVASVGLVKEVVEDLEIDTRNLLSDSKKIVVNGIEGTLQVVGRKLPISVKIGDGFTFNCDEFLVTGTERNDHALLLYDYSIGILSNRVYITPDITTATITVSKASTEPYLFIYAGDHLSPSGGTIIYKSASLVKGDKPMLLWQPSPEDVSAEITDAESRAKAYTDEETSKIESGETAAGKANSLYDDTTGEYKDWSEIDTAITAKIGDRFEDYATKSYVQEQISAQVAVPIASETDYGKVQLAKVEDITSVESDSSAVNDTAKAITPYTLKEYITQKGFTTAEDVSQAVSDAKPYIYYQTSQPSSGRDGDIWILP